MNRDHETPEEREIRIAKSVKSLDARQLQAYKLWLQKKQAPINEFKADELFKIFLLGKSVDDIAAHANLSLGATVAARVIYDWDGRKREGLENLRTNVPERAEEAHLEMVDFLGSILKATYKLHKESIDKFLETGNQDYLKNVPIPRSLRDMRELMLMFMSASGQNKKRVEVSGTVDMNMNKAVEVTADQAADILDVLLDDQSIEVGLAALPKPPANPKALGPNGQKPAPDTRYYYDDLGAKDKSEKVTRPPKAEPVEAPDDGDEIDYSDDDDA